MLRQSQDDKRAASPHWCDTINAFSLPKRCVRQAELSYRPQVFPAYQRDFLLALVGAERCESVQILLQAGKKLRGVPAVGGGVRNGQCRGQGAATVLLLVPTE